MVTTRQSPRRSSNNNNNNNKAPKKQESSEPKKPQRKGIHSKEKTEAIDGTQQDRKEPPMAKAEDDASSQHSKTPQAVSSSSSSSSDDDEEEELNIKVNPNNVLVNKSTSTSTPNEDNQTVSTVHRGYSRLFSPYRTVGVVADGPFHLLPNQNSANAVVCASIGERFHMVQCDKLQPVLVSHAVPGLPNRSTNTNQHQHHPMTATGPQKIVHIVSDNALSISVVTHGRHRATRVSLFQRTQPTETIETICPTSKWTIVDLLHLGKIQRKMTGEKRDKKENAALIAVILSKGKNYNGTDDDTDDDNDSDDDSHQNIDSDDDDDDDDDQCRGQVVLMVASRTTLSVHQRIKLNNFSSFCPRVAMHPPTYVNKIVIGGCCDKTGRDALVLVNVRTGKLIHTFQCLEKESAKVKSEITSLEPSPAIDTIAVGNSKGVVHLVNIRCDRLLFSLRHQSKNSQKAPTITSMSFRNDGSALKYGIAPLAIGRLDGTITIWDLSPPNQDDADELGDDHTTTVMGRTVLCEMERLHYPGGVSKLQYLPQEPLLISTGNRSNALLLHIFDNPDHSGRILRQRRGHTAPPKCIRYLHPGAGANGGILANMADGTDAHACEILSTGGNDQTLRKFSTVRSVLDKEFSQGKGLEKRAKELGMKDKTALLLPPVTAIATSEMRSRDWGDLVTIHKNHPFAYVWSSKNGAQTGPILRQDDWNVSAMQKQPSPKTHATSVAISTCGNYALVGTQGGTIYKYNVQSGMTRGTFPPNDTSDKKAGNMKDAGDIRRTFKALEKKMKLSNRASNAEKEELDRMEAAQAEQRLRMKIKLASHHGHAVTGIAVDSVNRTVISVGQDAKLILWSFASHAPHKKSPSELPAPASMLRHVKDSDLAAIVLDDYSTLLFDCTTFSIVRRFGAGRSLARHSGPVSDVSFSPDGRSLYTASLDGTIRVWDVPTNSCIDWLGFNTPPTSLTVSPTGEYLATTHTGRLGISLWSDRSFYQTVHVEGNITPHSPARMDDPAPIAEIESKDGDRADIDAFEAEEPVIPIGKSLPEESAKSGAATAKQEGLATLSGLPPAHWKNLFHLELVKQRNKPKEPPKKPPTAPFFLQWRPGVNSSGEPATNPETTETGPDDKGNDDWDAVWSDDDDATGVGNDEIAGLPPLEETNKRSNEALENEAIDDGQHKKRKISHYRSQLASLLEECANNPKSVSARFRRVTEYVGTLGPSAIDVSLSGLCNGAHDLEEGLPLLILASRWLIEACQSRERFDAVNAYLHRFLYLHSNMLAGIEHLSEGGGEKLHDGEKQEMQRQELKSYISQLKEAQRSGSEVLQGEMQNTLCLLRHFSRMV
ncbi:WD40 repeat-containing protein [Nitzschia inconspicua]|uniref:WD40 repeat-containing protein n=1 Tax=Nitzschia inconspicua TaxID=303405 RepID=A0A9K3PK80_9STRA|nr:WD40 repeat-containing protein [Nitzschia inconspicua]